MKYISPLLLIFLLISLNSCNNNKYDRIEFVDSFDYVQKSIIEFDSLLTYSNAKCKADYSFEFWIPEKGIEIGNGHGDDYVNTSLHRVCPEGKAAMSKASAITKVLRRNNISYVYKKYGTELTVFGYYYWFDTDKYRLREIIINRNSNKSMMSNGYEVMDARGKLVLFAMKN